MGRAHSYYAVEKYAVEIYALEKMIIESGCRYILSSRLSMCLVDYFLTMERSLTWGIFISQSAMLTKDQTYCTANNLTAESALQKLKEGNERYVLDPVEHPHEGAQHRVDISIKSVSLCNYFRLCRFPRSPRTPAVKARN